MSATIFIVEDKEDLLEFLEYSLQKKGYETVGFLNTKKVAQILDEDSENYQIQRVNVAIKRLKAKIDLAKTKEYVQLVCSNGYRFC